MKIKKVEAWQVSMDLDEPYSVAYESFDTAVNIFVRIETDSGINGFGCAAPDEFVTKGETPESVLKILKEVVPSAIVGVDSLLSNFLLENLKSSIKNYPSALAALDMAFYDILGKIAGEPLWKILGGIRENIKTSMTVGILPEKETIERALYRTGQGFSCLKLKGGNDVESDIARVIKVREAVGEGIEIRFDANQGYSVEETIRFAEKTESANLEFIEQPTPSDKPELMGQVTNKVSVPIMADESLITLEDAFSLARNEYVKFFNLKIMKTGGIRSACYINAVARSAGIKTMVGCMDESALSINAGLAFALSCPNVVYADLDGHIGLKGDPTDGAVIIRDGILYPSDQPGLGISTI